jgi:hypothetical protein
MDTPRRPIFREEAIRRYRQSTPRPVTDLPVVSPRVIVALWLLLGALLATGMICWFLVEAYR